MSETDVQALLDGVAAEVGAGVSLDDVELRLLAHTAHDLVDDVRQTAFVHRRLPTEMSEWFEQWGIREATGPLRTPHDETLGALARWCVPVRFRGILLGYVWILDAGRLPERDLTPAIEAANQIGAVLYRRRLAAQADTDILRLLLIPSAENEQLAAEARALGTYTHKGPVAVVVVGLPSGDEATPTAISDLTLAVQRTTEQEPPGAILGGVISGLGVLLAPLRSRDDLSPAYRFAERLRRLGAHVGEEPEIVAAIGGAAKLERASNSYAEARRTLRMVRAMPDLGPIALWNDLGIFRALSLLPTDDTENGVLDPRVRGLLADEMLASTAEVFLDLAGDVQQTAAKLFVHRTTLYQRLDRITALYELDLRRSGDHRLIAHLGFKLARVAGL